MFKLIDIILSARTSDKVSGSQPLSTCILVYIQKCQKTVQGGAMHELLIQEKSTE